MSLAFHALTLASALMHLAQSESPPACVREAVSIMYAEKSFETYRLAVDTEPAARTSTSSSFDGVYRHGRWNNGDQCFSGWSHVAKTRTTMDTLATVIDEYNIGSMVDLPCGDLCYMGSFLKAVLQVKPAFHYHGLDRVGFVVEHHRAHYRPPAACTGCNVSFSAMDARRSSPPTADLLFSRTMMQHMCTRDALRILRRIQASGAKYLLLSTYGTLDNAEGPQLPCDESVDTATNHQQQNLSAAPYSMPPPLRLFSEKLPKELRFLDNGKELFLGLWKARSVHKSLLARRIVE